MKLDKRDTRLRRALRGRVKIKELAALRLSVHRTPRHIYAQLFDARRIGVIGAARSRAFLYLDRFFDRDTEHLLHVLARKQRTSVPARDSGLSR